MKFKDFVNLTPHAINLELKDKTVISFPPSGKVLRLEEKEEQVTEYVVKKTYYVEGSTYKTLREDKTYIVSGIVLPYLRKDILGDDMMWAHYDFLAPDTGPNSVIRDSEGRIIAVRKFIAP